MCKDGGVAKAHNVSKDADEILSSAAAKRSTSSSTELKIVLLDEFASKPDKNFNIITIFFRTVSGTLLTSSSDLAGLDTGCSRAFDASFDFLRSTGPISNREGYF